MAEGDLTFDEFTPSKPRTAPPQAAPPRTPPPQAASQGDLSFGEFAPGKGKAAASSAKAPESKAPEGKTPDYTQPPPSVSAADMAGVILPRPERQYSAEHPPPESSFAESAARGLTLNWQPVMHGLVRAGGDHKGGAGSPLTGLGRILVEHTLGDPSAPGSATERYHQGLKEAAETHAKMVAENPKSALAGELVGAGANALATPGLTLFKAGAAAPLLMRAAAGAGNVGAAGALYGGIAGAGGAASRGENVIPGTAKGAALGTLTGVPLGAAGPLLGAPTSALRDAIARRFVPSVAQAAAQRTADQVVARSIGKDHADLEDAIRLMREHAELGQKLTLADVAGTQTQSEAGRIARLPSEARDPARRFLTERQTGTEAAPLQAARTPGAPTLTPPGEEIAGQGERLDDALLRLHGTEQGGRLATRDSIMARRGAAAEQMYPQAYRQPIDYNSPGGRQLLGMLDRVPQSARRYANGISEAFGDNPNQMIYRMNPETKAYELQTAPDTLQWRRIRSGLDRTIRDERDPLTGEMSEAGKGWSEFRRQIDEALGNQVPALKAADQVYSGHTRMQEAADAGARAWQPSKTREQVQREVAALSPGEREMYRHGAIESMRETAARSPDGADTVRRVAGNPAARQKMASIIGEGPALDEFNRFLSGERSQTTTLQRALGGSPTAERVTDEAHGAALHAAGQVAHYAASHGPTAAVGAMIGAGLGGPAGAALGGMAGAGRIGAMMHGAANALAKVDPRNRAGVLEAMSHIILNPDASAVRAFADRVNAAGLGAGTRRSVTGAMRDILQRIGLQKATAP